MRKEVPTWVAVVVILVVLIIVAGVYWWSTSARQRGEPSVTKPPATAIPGQQPGTAP